MAMLHCVMLLVLTVVASAAAAAPWSPSSLTASRSEDTAPSDRGHDLLSSTDNLIAVDGSRTGRDLLLIDNRDHVESDDGGRFSLDLRRVSTPDAFQAALEAGVRHIVLTAHLDMRKSPPPPDITGVQALNAGVGRVQRTTVSIVGRCGSAGQPPRHLHHRPPLPSGACVIAVKEDFLDIPLGSGDLLLDSLYVVQPFPRTSSSVHLLHVDGQLWVTNCVFQGALLRSNNRAIDVNTDDGGNPRLYVQDTLIRGFQRDLAPGIRVTNGASAYLERVTFEDLFVLTKPQGNLVEASAIAAYPGATLSLVNVKFVNNQVRNANWNNYRDRRQAGDQVVGVSSDAPRTIVYAEPQRLVWQWPSGGFILTATKQATTKFLRSTVAPVAAAMRRAQQKQRKSEKSHLR